METIDLTAEVEQPKPKAKSRAKAKAEVVVEESAPPPEPKPKAKGKAKAKAKAAAAPAEEEPAPAVEEPVPAISEANALKHEPPNEPDPAIASPDGEANEPPTEPTPQVVEAETTTRKPKGHRPKIENKEKLTNKVSCKKCDKTVSLHSIKYTHDRFCKSDEPEPPSTAPSSSYSAPPTLREKLQEKRLATAQRLISQCFKA